MKLLCEPLPWQKYTRSTQPASGHTPTLMAQLKNAMTSGRSPSGAYIKQPGKPLIPLSELSRSLSSNFRAETFALTMVARHLSSTEETPKNTAFLTDSMSALQSLASSLTDQSLEELKKHLSVLSRKSTVVLQWIPAHSSITGNEKADGLAKEGSNMAQTETCLSHREANTLIKTLKPGGSKISPTDR